MASTILSCAVTGNHTTRAQHPRVPITPEEIAIAAVAAAKAGAAIVHLHARDPATERGTMNPAIFREIVARIRDSGTDVILNLSTGEGGRFVPSDDEPSRAAAGTTLTQPEKRVAHVEALRPEICTLDFNTMFFGTSVVINTPRTLEIMAERIYAAGVLPEIEIFDTGDLHLANSFLERGLLKPPVMLQLVLGVRYGATADPATLLYYAARLPKDCIWAAFGIGRMQFPMLAQAFLLGGHVRVGLEDNVYIRRGVLARDNAELVEKGVDIVQLLGGTIATVAEARGILGLEQHQPDWNQSG